MRDITVYVKIPSTESLKTGSYNHTFLQLGTSSTEVYGLDPEHGIFENKPGRVVNDSWRLKAGDYQAKMTFHVTDEQYKRIVDGINKAIKNPPNYHLFAATSDDTNDRQCSMFVNDLLKSAGVKTDLTNYETPYTQYWYIKSRESYEPLKDSILKPNNRFNFDEFIKDFQDVPFSSIEHALKTYADSGQIKSDFYIARNITNEPTGNSSLTDDTAEGEVQPNITDQTITTAGGSDFEGEEEDMYAYSSFYPGSRG